MTMKYAGDPLSPPRTSLHGLGVKKVKLAIDYDSEERKIKRTVTITAEVSSEEAAQIDHLTKLNATFHADLHVEGYQAELTPLTPEEGKEETVDNVAAAALAAAERAAAEDKPKRRGSRKTVADPAGVTPGAEINKAAQTAKEELAAAPVSS